jgi:Mrp family chromosome partitioning ATPase
MRTTVVGTRSKVLGAKARLSAAASTSYKCCEKSHQDYSRIAGRGRGAGLSAAGGSLFLRGKRTTGKRFAAVSEGVVPPLDDSSETTSTLRPPSDEEREEVLDALRTIIDPDLNRDIVDCGFVKEIGLRDSVEAEDMPELRGTCHVELVLELTTPACPIKEEFKSQANANLMEQVKWVSSVHVSISSTSVSVNAGEEEDLGVPKGLRGVKNILAVSSCKGGVGKSTTCVNLAYTLCQMGAKVGIFDADVYGPSLPIMVSPEYSKSKLEMDPETKEITPVEYEQVKLVSFGFTTEGSAIMKGPLASGLVHQLLTTSKWGDLDYLLIDMPPGTGDIHLTIGQSVPITAAIIVTTPHKLAYADVAKGIRMFARLEVPCVSVVENMSYFDGDDGKRYFPFGRGSGRQIQEEFAIPHLIHMPIREEVSSGSDRGVPCVISEPLSDVTKCMQDLGVSVIREVSKGNYNRRKHIVKYEEDGNQIRVLLAKEKDAAAVVRGGGGDTLAEYEEFFVDPHEVRRNDQSAKFIDQLTGKPVVEDFPPDVTPLEIRPLGNYAVQISWSDGFNQIATYDQLRIMERK